MGRCGLSPASPQDPSPYGRDGVRGVSRQGERGREQAWGVRRAGGGVSEELEVYLVARGWEGRRVCGGGGCVCESWPVTVSTRAMVGGCWGCPQGWTIPGQGSARGGGGTGHPSRTGLLLVSQSHQHCPPWSLSARSHRDRGRCGTICGPCFFTDHNPDLFPPIDHHQTTA